METLEIVGKEETAVKEIKKVKNDYIELVTLDNTTYDKITLVADKISHTSVSMTFSIGTEIVQLPGKLRDIGNEIIHSMYILQLNDDWDDNGAKKIELPIWNNTVKFLINYSKNILDGSGYIIETPEINPCPDGSIDISWRSKKARLLINFKKQVSSVVLASFYCDNYDNKNILKGSFEVDDVKEYFATWMKNNLVNNI